MKLSKEGFDIDYQAKVGDIKKIKLVNNPDSSHPMQHPYIFMARDSWF